MKDFAGKVAVVAGGGTGIGAETARILASRGAEVVIADLREANAAAVAREIVEAGGRAAPRGFDITDEEQVASLMCFAAETYGGIDCVHVNAADMGAFLLDTDAVTIPLDVFDRTIAVNLRGHLLCTRHAVPALIERGGGSLVYTSSAAADFGEPARVAYAMSKSGVQALARHVATRWGADNIRANAVAPGFTLTETTRDHFAKDEVRKYAMSVMRASRIGQPADIAEMVAFLMSSKGEWITGQTIGVDGGTILR